ncbi:CBS domain-containing protein [Nannocystis pusilla]|uniref:CBS domain-containing protein n=1 Tax=Nannocystis pusilla TaxID=889268 RepID=UPI003BF07B9B
MNVGEICIREVVVVRPDEPLVTAARLMREQSVGDVVVVERLDDRVVPLGILTDRDIVVGPVANAPETLGELKVGDVATANLVTVGDHEDVLAVVESMRRVGVRRLPVVDRRGSLLGIVTFDDLVEVLGKELAGLGGMPIRAQQREERARRGEPWRCRGDEEHSATCDDPDERSEKGANQGRGV